MHAAIAAILKNAIGLDPDSVGINAIQRAIKTRMAGHGFEQVERYWEYLKESVDELQGLIETVVVPETWFFRDANAFSTLGTLVVNEWKGKRPRRPLRLLSIPCSTGEEPFSIVMTLLDTGLSKSEFHVDAVDVSVTALERAMIGEYGANSFRQEHLLFRDRYFFKSAHGFTISPAVRGSVTFSRGNLLSENFLSGETLYDAIFCRNLLIYFDRPTQDRAIASLNRLLAPAGYLFVGSAEGFLVGLNGFTSINEPMSFAFRRAERRPDAAAKAPSPLTRVPAVLKVKSPPSTQGPITRTAETDPPIKYLEKAMALADAGSLKEAARYCERYLKVWGPAATPYYLLGLVCGAEGDVKRAIELHRKALYLEPDHLQALHQLALLLQTQGDSASASRFRDRARRVEGSRKEQPA